MLPIWMMRMVESFLNDGPIEYDEFNTPITVGNFRMGRRHAAFGFYRHTYRPFKQGRNKLGVIYVLCSKALYGNYYDQWKWVNSTRVITNTTTNLL